MDEPFEKFEEDFESLEQSPTKATLDRMRDKIIHKMEDEGFRLLAIIDSNYPEESWDEVKEVYEEVETIVEEEGDVVFMDIGRSITKEGRHKDASFTMVENSSIYDEAKVEVAKYYDGDYDFNDAIFLPAADSYKVDSEVREARQKKLSYLGLKMKEVQKTDGNELKWVREPALTAKGTDRTYIWMTNAISIPQPFNMRLPSWLIEVIRNRLTKTKL